MKDLILEFSWEIRIFLEFLILPFAVFLISLSHVYFWGRMLNVIKEKYVSVKNLLAFLTQVGLYYYYIFVVIEQNFSHKSIWMLLLYLSLSIFFYINIGFRIFDDINHLQDRIFKKKKK